MELNEIIEKAKTDHGLSQNALASRIGLDKSSMSSILHGRRKLPAEAAIELFDLTGIHPREILKAAVRTTSCIALAVVLLFGTGAENSAYASRGFDAAKSQEYKLSCFLAPLDACRRPDYFACSSRYRRARFTASEYWFHRVCAMTNACR